MRGLVRGRSAGWWVAFGTIAFGTLFLAIGVILAADSLSYATSAERARGTVVSLEWRTDHSGGSSRHRSGSSSAAYPVVAFTTADGRPRTFRSSGGSNPPAYDVGERVGVLYRADSPGDARIDGFLSLWLLPLVFGGIGLLIAAIGMVVAVVRRRGRVRNGVSLTKSGVAPAEWSTRGTA